jgi:alpha-L-fucosidase
VLQVTFKNDVARGAIVTASSTRNNNPAYSAANVADGDKNTYWITDDDVTTATIELDLGREKTFNRIMLQEYIQRGQRIEEFVFDLWDGENWRELARGTTVGYKRILRINNTTVQKVRLRILQSRVCPTISCFSLFYAPLIDEILKN